MVKQIIEKNDGVLPNSREMEVLKQNFPSCFNAEGNFDIERFKEFLKDKVNVTKEGYELKFLGKNYARLLASVDTTTVIVPDEENNSKPENKDSENIYITGDNLDALKHLLQSYSGKVKCIYIDPPYNTGSDGFVYNDRFNFTAEDLAVKLSIEEEQAERILDLTKRGSASHSAWLMFMYPRLLLARDLLSDDGVIFISIDDNEQSNLKLLCDDVFGEQNMITCITRATGTPTGGGFDGVVNEMDYLLVYCKCRDKAIIRKLEMTEEDAKIYDEIDEEGNRYLTRSLRRTGGEDRREDRPTMYYALVDPDGNEIYPIGPTGYESRWICSINEAKALEKMGMIVWKKRRLMGKEVWHPYQKYYLDGRNKAVGNIWRDLFNDIDDGNDIIWDKLQGNKKATKDIRLLFADKKVFETAKPVDLIIRILRISCDNNSIVLDFFSGSATTAHAVMQLNAEDGGKRKFVMVQLPEQVKADSEAERAGYKTIDQIGRERIRRAAAKIKAEHPGTTADLGFKHYVLQEPQGETLDKLEKFVPEEENGAFLNNDIFGQFGLPTVLTTWLVRDGYGLNAQPKELDFAGYKGYYIGQHLYLIEEGLTDEAVTAIVTKFDDDGTFNPDKIVVFGYNFLWTKLQALKDNLSRLKDTEKNIRIVFDVRY